MRNDIYLTNERPYDAITVSSLLRSGRSWRYNDTGRGQLEAFLGSDLIISVYNDLCSM